MTHHHNNTTATSNPTTTAANTSTSNSKHFDQDHHQINIGRSRASSNANVRNSERSRSASNASVSSTTMYCAADSTTIQQQQHNQHNQQYNQHYPNQTSNTTTNIDHHNESSSSVSTTANNHHQHHQPQSSRVSSLPTTTTSTLPNTTTTNVQQLNLMRPTPQQRLTIERLLQISPESVQSRNPKLYDLLVQLRRQYMWQAVTTPITTPITTLDKANNTGAAAHPLEKMKQEDAMVFSSHIDEICACVNQLLEELDSEEYGLVQNPHTYKAVWLQEVELKERAKIAPPSLEDDEEHHEQMHDEEECDEECDEEFEEQDGDHTCPQPSSSTAPTMSSNNDDHHDDEETTMEDDETTNTNTTSAATNEEDQPNSTVNAQSQDASSNTKLQEFFRQLENVEPIPNGKLSFFQNHHLVVGKFDKKLLVEDNVLSCTVMKKSTLNVVVHRRCTRLNKDNERFPFDSTAGNYHDRRILKKQSLAKSVVRFAKVKVDFGRIVSDVIGKCTTVTSSSSVDENDKK